jgi:hypothetical protein
MDITFWDICQIRIFFFFNPLDKDFLKKNRGLGRILDFQSFQSELNIDVSEYPFFNLLV